MFTHYFCGRFKAIVQAIAIGDIYDWQLKIYCILFIGLREKKKENKLLKTLKVFCGFLFGVLVLKRTCSLGLWGSECIFSLEIYCVEN
jgi:hypothetical protein